MSEPQAPEPQESKDFLLAGAGWQDDLLQNYRSFSLTLQSVMLAVGAVLVGAALQTQDKLAVVLLFVPLVVVAAVAIYALAVLASIVSSRGRDVTWWHTRLLETELDMPGPQTFWDFKRSQRGRGEKLSTTFLGLFRSPSAGTEVVARNGGTNLPRTRGAINDLLGSGISFTRNRIDKHLLAGIVIAWGSLILIELIWMVYRLTR